MGQQLPVQHVATVGSSEASRLHQLNVHPINTSQTSLLEGLIHAMFYTHVHTMCDRSGTSHPLAPQRAGKLRVERALGLQDSRGAPTPNQHPVQREGGSELRLPSTGLLAVSERLELESTATPMWLSTLRDPESVSKFRVLCVHELLSKKGRLEKNGPHFCLHPSVTPLCGALHLSTSPARVISPLTPHPPPPPCTAGGQGLNPS